MTPTGEPPLTDHASHRVSIGTGPIPRPENHGRSGFGIFESRLIIPGEAYLGRIHDMKNENLMAPMPKKAKRLERQGPVQQQIRDKYDQASTTQLSDYPPKRGFRRGAAAGLGSRQYLE